MIADKITNLIKYPQLAKYEKEIIGFLQRLDNEKLAPGKYELLDDELFALVQRYETKPKEGSRMESHVQYADLQYIHKGEEKIYYDTVEDMTVCEDRRPESDILFYEIRPDKGYSLLSAGMFAYYEPQDGHMPCIISKKRMLVEKVVFKIKVY